MTSSTQTEEASCFTPRLSCSADTRTVGAEVNYLCYDNNQREHCKKKVSNAFLIESKPKNGILGIFSKKKETVISCSNYLKYAMLRQLYKSNNLKFMVGKKYFM